MRLINVLLIACLIASCENSKVEKPPVEYLDIWSCYHDSIWDEAKVRNALIGTWHWEYVLCFWSPDQAHSVIDSNVTIEFKTDSFLVVKQRNEIIQTSRWHVGDGDADLFSIEDDPSNTYLFGRILICDDRVIFNGSYIDLCDNYFKKIN